MSNADLPGWKPLTGLDEHGANNGRLLAALLTTYDPPDPGILIEEYLPVWLGLKNSYADEGNDRLRYFAELEDALRRLKGRISIVSSAGAVGTSAEAWIWNYIRRFEVGAVGTAVQHAKLWMFHRAPASDGESETLEIVISSGNLTRDGLRGQIQAGWRCILQLDVGEPKGEWGLLPKFLNRLGAASGRSGPKTTDYWMGLLRRCQCPKGVEFIASVPGTHTAATLDQSRTPWGAAGLQACLSGHGTRKMIAMAPTIGRWTPQSITAWTKFIGLEPDRISVAWVRKGHPWASWWQLDPSTEKAMTDSRIQWLEVPCPDDDDWASPLCDDHQKSDRRWSHAKVYELRQGVRRRILITSANLSRAAWGDPQSNGGLVIANFELGVLMKVESGFADRLSDVAFVRATCEIDYEQTDEQPISWLAAEWDGDVLTVECRTTSKGILASHVTVTTARSKSGKRVSADWSWSSDPLTRTKLSWLESDGVPVLIAVEASDDHVRKTAVHDIRPNDNGEILCGEFDEALLRETLDRLIEERYGYASDPGSDGAGGHRRSDTHGTKASAH